MQSFSAFPAKSFMLLSTLLCFLNIAVTEQGFCSAPSVIDSSSNAQPLYSKVTNPTLSPSHLQDLPGFTRSMYRSDHALITPESHVFSPLPDWSNTLGAYLVSPAMGAHFVMYIAKMQEGSKSGLPPKHIERFVFVVQGLVTLTNVSGICQTLMTRLLIYLLTQSISSKVMNLLHLLYLKEGMLTWKIIFPSQLLAPLINSHFLTPPERQIMDFQPGEFLNVKEVHYNQHGLLLLEGQGIYRLGDSWYPVEAGDAIWMAPFVPQWYAALGKVRTRYLLYKDVNRNPL
ncbi:Cupin 2, conserved barrel [Cynara cardunculus var. scolymus]|uniref:Cupin 2, conserved barrel n=1 Tax=Cynara cardunculus var. scolymus TaxID=59895 RepID=A0A103XQX4_CYNCS|nr:Cupin 2, conserved barrel [Cynara cardunculus var. scolymus]